MSNGIVEIRGVSKNFADVKALNNLTFQVKPGEVTGFLGPNGSGKSTTLRILLGLIKPDSGSATISGERYADLNNPIMSVGAALDTVSFHPGITGRNHLRALATVDKIANSRTDELLNLVGLSSSADRKIGGYSLGMKQRLGLAAALLGDPKVLILDEPINGLDPEGIRWMRGLLRNFAADDRTVLISSHMLSEVEQTVDRLIVINHGKLVFEGSVEGLGGKSQTLADAEDRVRFAAALTMAGMVYSESAAGLLIDTEDRLAVGRIALASGNPLTLLRTNQTGLEDNFLDLIQGSDLEGNGLEGNGAERNDAQSNNDAVEGQE